MQKNKRTTTKRNIENGVKGITLIALIVTIVILIILAGVSINIILGNDGIIETTKKTAFYSEMKAYEEEIQNKITAEKLKDGKNKNVIISVGLEEQESIKTILPNIKENYENEVIVQNNKMYYKEINTNESKQRVEWCLELEIPVWEYKENENPNDTENKKPYSKGEYTKIANTYCCAPDLTGFNVDCTYYIYYDGNKEILGNKVCEKAPEKWYNYENKEWANIVTINERLVTYYTWIPRYVYKANSDKQKADVKFVDKDNTYKNSAEEIEKLEIQTTKGNEDNYKLPEAFEFGGQQLAGYWMTKYEISEQQESDKIEINYKIGSNEITISNVIGTSTGNKYEIYVDEKLQDSTTTILPYTIKNLKPNTEYNIEIFVKDNTEDKIIDIICEKVKTLEADIKKITKPDLTGFNPDCTFYVTYNSSGNEKSDIKISEEAPDDWYDYENKKWANIKTVNNGLTAYFTWIPRYEYKLKSKLQELEVRFITKSQKEATNGYYMPEAFKFGTQELSGYWISKYEISE